MKYKDADKIMIECIVWTVFLAAGFSGLFFYTAYKVL